MARERFSHVTRWSLYLLIASIGVGSVLAIGIVVAGDWSWPQVRILLTALTLAAGSVLCMACGAALARGGSPLPMVGIGVVVIAGVLLLVGMWAEIGSIEYWKATASVSFFAVASAHAALLSLARLASGHRWIQVAAYLAAFGFASGLTLLVYGSSSDALTRPLAVIGIVDAALSLTVPIVHLLDHRQVATASPGAGSDAIDAEIDRLRKRLAELEQAGSAAQSPPAGP